MFGRLVFKFSVRLTKAKLDEPVGLSMDNIPGTSHLVILEVKNGAVRQHNKLAPRSNRFRRYDCITSVNGETNIDAMFKALHSAETLSLSVTRPREVTVTIQNLGRELGLRLMHTESGRALYVKALVEGGSALVSGADILPGDLIIALNQRHVKAEDLIAEAKKSDSVELLLLRFD